MELTTDKMISRKEGGAGWMIFNNPERRNALSMEMQQAIPVILNDFQRDPKIRVVVMAGAGEKAFVSGADISEFEKRRSDPKSIAEFDRISADANRAYANLEKPLIAMIRGFCMGGGLLTALQADIRVASDDSVFGIPAARLGLGYGFGGTQKVVETVGAAAAREILFTGGRFPATDALRWGLVNRVVPAAKLDSTVKRITDAISENAPLTVNLLRASIVEATKEPTERDLQTLETMVEACFTSKDYIEGRQAFMEKRRPQFRGQ
ncbi:MAG: enoyl-CoA hydratase [Dehalococcoidia bacterium]|nr:enoyl-CoA hydratase [Dehalococcoidia bacterium]|tara:strand:- start:24430 stop:25224 length:795 start_codon:yes stop_codon:yes gene_type:complete